LKSRDYDEPFEAAKGVTATLYDAGHILGSASISLNVEEKKQKTHLWFSGDIGRRDMPI
jgi:metallo-beta-lactamase family protein